MATLSHEDDSDDSDGDKSDGNADGNGDDFQYGNDDDDVIEQTWHLMWRP